MLLKELRQTRKFHLPADRRRELRGLKVFQFSAYVFISPMNSSIRPLTQFGGLAISDKTTSRCRNTSAPAKYSRGDLPATRARRQPSVWRTTRGSRALAQVSNEISLA